MAHGIVENIESHNCKKQLMEGNDNSWNVTFGAQHFCRVVECSGWQGVPMSVARIATAMPITEGDPLILIGHALASFPYTHATYTNQVLFNYHAIK